MGAEAATTVVVMREPAIQKRSAILNYRWQLQCNQVSVNKLNKKSSSKKSPNHCCICEVKHGSKLDNDYDSPWIGCSANKCETWLHLYCLGFMSDNGSDVKADWFCKKHHPRKPPAQR